MSLKLLLAEPCDLPRIVQLENEAFANSSLTPILFPNGVSKESGVEYVERLRQQWKDDTAGRHVKVIDTDLNDKIIAFARWYIFIGDDVKFIKTDPTERHSPPGCNEAAADEFFGNLLKKRIKLLGKNPHCYLSTLCTDPQHQRRGAATMLTKWGCEIAERAGVPAFLEASPDGLPVYEKAGFKAVDTFTFNLANFGGKGTRVNVQMIKHPENIRDTAADVDIPGVVE